MDVQQLSEKIVAFVVETDARVTLREICEHLGFLHQLEKVALTKGALALAVEGKKLEELEKNLFSLPVVKVEKPKPPMLRPRRRKAAAAHTAHVSVQALPEPEQLVMEPPAQTSQTACETPKPVVQKPEPAVKKPKKPERRRRVIQEILEREARAMSVSDIHDLLDEEMRVSKHHLREVLMMMERLGEVVRIRAGLYCAPKYEAAETERYRQMAVEARKRRESSRVIRSLRENLQEKRTARRKWFADYLRQHGGTMSCKELFAQARAAGHRDSGSTFTEDLRELRRQGLIRNIGIGLYCHTDHAEKEKAKLAAEKEAHQNALRRRHGAAPGRLGRRGKKTALMRMMRPVPPNFTEDPQITRHILDFLGSHPEPVAPYDVREHVHGMIDRKSVNVIYEHINYLAVRGTIVRTVKNLLRLAEEAA